MKRIQQAIDRAISALSNMQLEDGRFEGRLSSNTYPTCVYALIKILQAERESARTGTYDTLLDKDLIDWFLRRQTPEGLWSLDLSEVANQNATALVKLILEKIPQKDRRIVDAIDRTPEIAPNSWMVKVFYALCGRLDWDELVSSKTMIYLMKIMLPLMQVLPESLRAKLKPAEQSDPPPVDLFSSSMFEKLFIAEQYTLVPFFLIIELNTQKREEIITELLEWLGEHVLSDGSWFRVGYITGLSVLALIEAQKHGYDDKLTESMVQKGIQWLESIRNQDGGIREAINLNVWDTALSIVALLYCGVSEKDQSIREAARWLVRVQNEDGGWAFSGIENGNLPSDADDTALATLALLRAKIPQNHPSIAKAITWLKSHQAKDGSWGTYVPGQGDVGCVSITSHVLEVSLEVDGFDAEREKAIKWLKKRIEKSGYWSDLWLAKNSYGTASAIAALIKVGEVFATSHTEGFDEIARGVDWLHRAQNPDGGWGENMSGELIDSTAEQTAWSSYALLLANSNDSAALRGVDLLLHTQNKDGSWPSSCVGIYWEMIGGYKDPIYALVFPMLALGTFKG